MARPNWEYIRVDVLMPTHPKLIGASSATKWCLIEAWCYCARHLTDGFVPVQAWRRIGKARDRLPLVETGLAVAVTGGYQMHDYLGHQRSRADVEALSLKRAAAGRKGGHAKADAVALAKQTPASLPPSKPSKSLAEAEAEAEADRSVADVVPSSSGRYARARELDDDRIISKIKSRTGHAIARDEVPAIRDLILAGRLVSSPIAYVLQAIDDEPDPSRRFLNGSASEAGRHPSAVPSASVCRRCGAGSHPTEECPI